MTEAIIEQSNIMQTEFQKAKKEKMGQKNYLKR